MLTLHCTPTADPSSRRFNRRGLIYLNGEGLPEGLSMPDTDQMIYGVSVLHQLHCLV